MRVILLKINKHSVRVLVHKYRHVVFAVLCFLAFTAFTLLFHEMWRDEVQAWLLAKDSSNLKDLYNNLRYEGTPGLWHLALVLIQKVKLPIQAMQILSCALVAVSVYVFTRFAPFSRTTKLLFAGSYFIAYEYSVIARNYSIAVLLLLLLGVMLTRKKPRYVWASLLLFLLMQVSTTSALLAVPFALYVACQFEVQLRRKVTRKLISKALVCATVLLIGALLYVVQVISPPDASVGQGVVVSFCNVFAAMAAAFLPFLYSSGYNKIPILNNLPHIANYVMIIYVACSVLVTSTLFVSNREKLYMLIKRFGWHWLGGLILGCSLAAVAATPEQFLTIIMVILLAYAVYVLRGSRLLQLCFFLACSLSFFFSFIIYTYSIRHWGLLFIFYIVCSWLALATKKPRGQPELWRKELIRFVTILLVLQVFASVFALYKDWRMAFSNSKITGKYLNESQELANYTWLFNGDTYVSPIAAYTTKQDFAYRESRGSKHFVVWNVERAVLSGAVSDKSVLERVDELKKKSPEPVLVVSVRRLNDERFVFVKSFVTPEYHIRHDGSYYLYEVH